MLFREKEALFYDRRVILYSVQVFGSLGRNGVKNTCTAILGVFFIDFKKQHWVYHYGSHGGGWCFRS